MILAAIDIGSNAARLLISEVTATGKEKPTFSKLNLVRIPLRLGFDVFESGSIPPEKVAMMLHTMHAFRSLCMAYKVDHYIACATSAMRDAGNATALIEQIRNETGIHISVISGDMEATMIFENHIAEKLNKNNSYLYIDVGGGSTELSLFTDGGEVNRKSFNIGTIRLLQNRVSDQQWEAMKDHVRSLTRSQKSIVAIGSGGNINKVFMLSKKKEGRPLHINLLRDYYHELEQVPLEERISRYNLRKDRADVIVPALSIYIQVMRWAGAEEIYVPKIGLADGLIQHLYAEVQQKQSA